MPVISITRKIAQKVRDTVDAGLSHGLGNNEPGEMCVEAAVCFALGLSHGDDPGCVAQSLRHLKIRLNDSSWSSNTARAAGLRRLAVAQLGSAGVLDEEEFVRRVVDVTIRKAVPVGLRAASSINPPKHAEALEAAAVRCESEGSHEALQAARAAAASAAASAASYVSYASAAVSAASDAYDAASYASAAASAASDAASYASYASYAVSAAADAASYASAAARTRDRVIAEYAEWIVGILIDMRAPGCEWLDLVPLEDQAS